jgi:hypothetical protein
MSSLRVVLSLRHAGHPTDATPALVRGFADPLVPGRSQRAIEGA